MKMHVCPTNNDPRRKRVTGQPFIRGSQRRRDMAFDRLIQVDVTKQLVLLHCQVWSEKHYGCQLLSASPLHQIEILVCCDTGRQNEERRRKRPLQSKLGIL